MALGGAATAGYTVYLHHLISSGGSVDCGLIDSLNCNRVLTSDYGKIMGVPVGVFGTVYFLVLALLSCDTEDTPLARRRNALGSLVLSGAGVAAGIGFLYIALGVIKAGCPWCFATHTFSLLYFLVAMRHWLRYRGSGALW